MKSRIWIIAGCLIAAAALYGYRLYEVNKHFVIHPETKLYAMGEPVPTGDLATTVQGVSLFKEYEGLSAQPGFVFAIFDVSIQNIGDQSAAYRLTDYVLYRKFDVYVLDYDAQIQLKSEGNFEKSKIEPGEMVTGKLVYQIPENTKALEFKYPAREIEQERFQFLKETTVDFMQLRNM